MSSRQGPENPVDESRLAGLIRQGGARPRPDAQLQAAAREAVAAEWRAVVAARRRRLRQRWSLAAAAVLAAVVIGLTTPGLVKPGPMVAAVTRVSGAVDVAGGGLLAPAVQVSAGQQLHSGSRIRSGTGGRLALDINGLTLRLDQESELVVLARDRVELRHGAAYLDSGARAAASPRLTVATRFGEVEHLGTQYETRVSDLGLRLRVREGRVRLLRPDGEVLQGGAGEQVLIGADGVVGRQRIPRGGADWAWVNEVAPAYDIEDRSLLDFLHWVSRETGRDLVFGSPAAEQAARGVVLHGSVQGLSPERALSAVLVTTALRYTETAAGLQVDFKTGN